MSPGESQPKFDMPLESSELDDSIEAAETREQAEAKEAPEGLSRFQQLKQHAQERLNQVKDYISQIRGTESKLIEDLPEDDQEDMSEALAATDEEMQAVLLDAEQEANMVIHNVGLRELSKPDLSPIEVSPLVDECIMSRSDQGENIARIIAEHHPGQFSETAQTLGLSNEQILEIISGFTEDKRKELLKNMDVFVPEKGKAAKGEAEKKIGEAEKSEKKKTELRELSPEEAKETVEKLKNTGRELSDYLIADLEKQIDELTDDEGNLLNPGDAQKLERLNSQLETEQKNREIEDELHGEIDTYEQLGTESANDVQVIALKKRGSPRENLPAVYKPRNGEEPLRKSIEQGSYHKREWLASQIDKAIGLNIVPVTIVRDGPKGIGSVQDWFIGKMAIEVPGWEDTANQAGLERLAVLDVLVGNTDRHRGNFMVAANGETKGIDNGLILRKDGSLDYIRSRPQDVFTGKMVSEGIRTRLEEFRSSPEKQALLKKCFMDAIEPEQEGQPTGDVLFNEFMQRLDALFTEPIPETDQAIIDMIEEAKRKNAEREKEKEEREKAEREANVQEAA